MFPRSTFGPFPARRLAFLLATLGFTASAYAGGLHDHVKKYRVVQGYILQTQAPASAVVVAQQQNPPSSAPSSGSNVPSLKLASEQAPKNELSLAPAPSQPSTPQNQTVTLQLAPAQPQTMTLQLAPAPAQTLQLNAAPMVQTLQLAPVQTQTMTLQLAAPAVQTLQLAAQPATTPSVVATPVQILLPKHQCFLFGR
jgi:hypothetical protein